MIGNAARKRRKRRADVVRLTLYLLDQKEDGWRFADLHKIVQDSLRARVSRSGMGLIMRPYFLSGEIIRERVSDHGIETHVWRKPLNARNGNE